MTKTPPPAPTSVIKGVGEAIASKMVAAFGERTLEARHPESKL